MSQSMTVTILAVLAVASLCAPALCREDEAPMPDLGQTWVEIEGTVYGAKPDATGPIGGGAGYTKIVTDGQYKVATVEELVAALGKAQAGEIIFIDPRAELDLTTLVYAEKLVLNVPGGVTIASDRGQNGSLGALIYSDAFQTAPMFLAEGPDVRFTGLRVRGPDPKRRVDHHRRAFSSGREGKDASSYYYKFPVSEGIRTTHPGLQVDNCELSGFSHAAIHLSGGDRHHLHHNQYHGLGYGVTHGYLDKSQSLIEYNVFDYNRHSIAGTGKPGNAYEAANNVELGHANGHYFDMHGGRDRRDGTTIAGDWMKVHHNTFMLAEQAAIVIRGVPQQIAEIHHNWFAHPALVGTIRPWPCGGETHVTCESNAYGREKPAVLDKS
ncbi:MAG: hypothetical protein ACYC63_03615 [Armatimonadota bacterium]